MVRAQCFSCHGPASIPGWGTKILKAVWHSPTKKNVNICLKFYVAGTGRESPSHVPAVLSPSSQPLMMVFSSSPNSITSFTEPTHTYSSGSSVFLLPSLSSALSSPNHLSKFRNKFLSLSHSERLEQGGWVGSYSCTPTAYLSNSLFKQSHFPPIEEFKCQMLK